MAVGNHIRIYFILSLLNICLNAINSIEPSVLQSSEEALLETCENYFGCGRGFYTGFKQCCVTCSCNHSCIDTHSCCPESEYAYEESKPYRSDVKAVCRNTVLRGLVSSIYDHPEYEFIETCYDTNDETTILYCEDIAVTNRSGIVADNTPVLDTTSGVSYGNIYCAMCNGFDVSTLEVWRPKLNCQTNFDLRSESFGHVNGLERLIEYNNCHVSFEPPASYATVKQCYADVISSCNVTGRWLTYNETDVIQCQTLNLIYVSIEDFRRKYKNIFCAKCNGETVYTLSNDFCPFVSNRFTVTLTTILGFTIGDLGSISQTTAKHLTNNGCPLAFKQDPLTGRCRSIYCSLPFNVDSSTSTCRLFHQYIDNGNFAHAYKLVPSHSIPIRDAQTITEVIYARVMEDDDLNTCDVHAYYQTDTIQINYPNNSVPLGFNISGIYIIVYSRITKANPNELFGLFGGIIRAHMDYVEAGILGPEGFDPGMLRYNNVEEVNWIRLEEENFNSNTDDSPPFFVFQNIYEGSIIISPRKNSKLPKCKPRVYEEDFLPCTSFLYHVSNIFHRVPHGLLIDYNESGLVLNFSEFKTVNRTTVRICTDSIISKTSAVSAAAYPYAFHINIFFIMLMNHLRE